MASAQPHSDSRRRHRARQIRARVVQLAREYRQRTEVLAGCNEAVDLGAITVEDEERCFQAVLEVREALFSALEELDMLEEDVSDRTTAATLPR